MTDTADDMEVVRGALYRLAGLGQQRDAEGATLVESAALAALDRLAQQLAALNAQAPSAKASGWLEPWEAAELRERVRRLEEALDRIANELVAREALK